MSAINDLINKIEDADLRKRIEAELNRLLEKKDFGLVFEDHQPEGLDEGPIYPSLQLLDEVTHAPDKALWHALIEADNYYALQLLAYLYPGTVDCIYIDPPYNTGARDWKYNNDYVDTSDQYRHSKWLSMMKRRLLLAKELLNPKDSVLIVTIDEKEYLHLGCLLEELFSGARMQMVSSVINPSGTTASNGFSQVDEFIYFVFIGDVHICKSESDMLFDNEQKKSSRIKNGLSWESFLRSGQDNVRENRPNLCYPILVDEKTERIIECLQPLVGEKPELPKYINGYRAVYPIKNNGKLGIWRLSAESITGLLKEGYAYVSSYDSKNDTYSIKYLLSGIIERINKGELIVERTGEKGQVIAHDDYSALTNPKTVWNKSSHNAGKSGTDLLNKIFNEKRFPFPKSLYAVHDAIRFFVANKPNALIVDFFAGSGTTLHAVNLLNAEDGGNRRCIMVTNNEVSEQEAKELTKKGFKPGDEEWERWGIARYVNWPRTVCSIEGHDVNGQPLKGEYLGTDHRQMKDGFEANCAFFKLNFLDKTQVELGRQFRELIPILWMKAGAEGQCPRLESNEVPPMLVLPENRFAVLTDEKAFGEFLEKVEEQDTVRTVYLVVDSDSMYREMARCFPKRQPCQLYRDYLDNFRINMPRQ